MAPEAYRAQVLPDLGSKMGTTPTKLGVLCNFCLIKIPPKCMAEAPEPPFVGQGVQPNQVTWCDPNNFDFSNSPSK